MVLRFNPRTWLLLALPLIGCVQPNDYGLLLPDAAAAAEDGPPPPAGDAAPDAAPADAPVSPRDSAVPDAAPVADAAPPPDALAMECTPSAVGCTPDNHQVRTCNAQGRWVVGQTCATTDVCSAGVCLCASGSCDEGSIYEIDAAPLAGSDLAASGQTLYVALSGLQPSIRRLDIRSPTDVRATTIDPGNGGFTRYALDTDPAGKLIWCRQTDGKTSSGELRVEGNPAALDPAPCTYVRRVGDVIYYKTMASLNRRPLGAGSASPVTDEPMEKFELVGDSLYFIGQTSPGGAGASFLKRLSLSSGGQVDTIASRDDLLFLGLLADSAHLYAWGDAEILRVPLAGGQPQTVVQETGANSTVWAMVQTESHLYWSTAVVDAASQECQSAKVSRSPKSGGAAALVSQAEGRCAGDLVVLGDRLYVAYWSARLPAAVTEIHRVRL